VVPDLLLTASEMNSRMWTNSGTQQWTAALFFLAVILRGGLAGAADLASSLAPVSRLLNASAAPVLTIAPATRSATAAAPGGWHHELLTGLPGCDRSDRIGLTTSVSGNDPTGAPAHTNRRRCRGDAFAAAPDVPQAQPRRRQRDESRQILRL